MVHICLNPIVKVGSTNNSKITHIRNSFVEINVFLILIFSNRRCGTSGIRSLSLRSLSVRLYVPVTEQVENNIY
jgi:hypothetical protein